MRNALHHIALTFGLLTATPAFAGLSGTAAGPWVDVGGGLTVDGPGPQAGYAVELGLGGWAGRYDDAMALGRHWGFGARLRLQQRHRALRDAPDLPAPLRIRPQFAFHRAIDLVVVGVRLGAMAGPELATVPGQGVQVVGGGARVTAGASWRFRPPFSLGLRADLGADVELARVHPAFDLTLSMQWTPRSRARTGEP